MRDRTDPAITRSEEELLVTAGWAPSERVRIRKRIITEDVQFILTLQREELYVEREPLGDGAGGPGGELRDREVGEEALLFTLHREEPVVEARVVPYEHVRVVKYVTSEARVIEDELRAERLELRAERVDVGRPDPPA